MVMCSLCRQKRRPPKTIDVYSYLDPHYTPNPVPGNYETPATSLQPEQYSTVEAVPYETPLRNSVLGRPSSKAVSFRPQGSTLPALYEEPVTSINSVVPRDYEVAVIPDTNVTYSSVDDASNEMKDYLNANGYSSLHPPTLDREQHIYTPPLQQTSTQHNEPSDSELDASTQEPTYFTLEDTRGDTKDPPSPHQERESQKQGEDDGDVLTIETELNAQPQEHTYFTLGNKQGDIRPVNQEGEGGVAIDSPLYFHLVNR